MALDICFTPLVGGPQNTGRQMNLGYSVQRTSGKQFPDQPQQ